MGPLRHQDLARAKAGQHVGGASTIVGLAHGLDDDSDTVAAVTGQLAGALYGRAGISAEWLDQLVWRGQIEAFAERLCAIGQDRAALDHVFYGIEVTLRGSC